MRTTSPIIQDLSNLYARAKLQERLARRRLFLSSIPPIVLAIGLLLYFSFEINRSRNRLELLANNVDSLSRELRLRSLENDSLVRNIDSLHGIYHILQYNADQDFGWSIDDMISSDSSKIAESQAAHSEVRRLINTGGVDVGITVRYYTKRSDRGKIDLVLKKCGYRRIIVDNDDYRSPTPTNAVYFAPEVGIENVKLIAYSLIRAGAQVNVIRPYSERIRSLKPNSIEISGDKRSLGASIWTVERIRLAKSFE